MKSLRMVHIIILAIFYFLKGVQATCPNLTNSSKNLDIIDRNESFFLYQYTSVDERVKSPFSRIEGNNKKTKLEDRHINSDCKRVHPIKEFKYNFAKMNNFDNQTGKIKLEYRNDSLDLSCHTKFINFRYIFQSSHFVSN